MKKTYYTVDGAIIGESANGVRTDYMTDALGSVTGTLNQSGEAVQVYFAPGTMNPIWAGAPAACVAACKTNGVCLAICAVLESIGLVWIFECSKSNGSACIRTETKCGELVSAGCCTGF